MPNSDPSQPAAAAAVALATASAAAGMATAEAGYQLTQEAVTESGAPLIIPLLLLELTAIAEGFTAYAATEAAWKLAEGSTRVATAAANLVWGPKP